MLLEGLHIPLTTPFQADGSLALPRLAANVARYSKTPAAGLIVLGPSAEPTLLSDDETRDVLSTAAHAAAPEKVLLAGITRDSVRSVLALADFAAQLHYDAILLPAPTTLRGRWARGNDELLLFFQAVADRSPLPIVISDGFPRPSIYDALSTIATHPNVVGCINGARRSTSAREVSCLRHYTALIGHEVPVTSTFAAVTARMKLAAAAAPAPALVSAASLTGATTLIAERPPLEAALRARSKRVGFQILQGDSGSLLEALHAGAVGIAPVFAAAAPQACYEVYAAWKDGDQPLAEEKQQRIREAAYLAESLGPGGIKFACDLNGYAAGLPRLPHLPPDGSQRAALEAAMHGLRN